VKVLPVVLSFCYFAVAASAQDCRSVLGHQSADAASIKQVEHAWTEAFLHGGTGYLGCLLTPDYVSVSAKGVPRDRGAIIGIAEKNKGKSDPIPSLPEPMIEIYGNTAVVRSDSPGAPDGKYPAMYSADIFSFQDGAWHAVYSQHTAKSAN
jgi:Domain of unknown function (DUF4440)